MKRRNKVKRVAAFLAALILMTLSLCQAVFAADTAGIDPAKPVSLSIDLEAQGRCATISLYRVGEWDGSQGKYVLTKEFAQSGAKIDVTTTEEMLANSEKLEKYAADQKLAAAASLTTKDGKGTVTGLTSGLYLICQRRGTSDNVTVSPFLTTLPVLDEKTQAWDYDVDCHPKRTDDKPTTPSKPDGGGSGSGGGGGGSPTGGAKKTPDSSSAGDPGTPQEPGETEPTIEIDTEGVPIYALPKTGDESMPVSVLVGAMVVSVFIGVVLIHKMRRA